MLNVPAQALPVETLPALPGRAVFNGMEAKTEELWEVWCLVPKTEHDRGWQSVSLQGAENSGI